MPTAARLAALSLLLFVPAAAVSAAAPAATAAETCPKGFTWDGANCFLGHAPGGTVAVVTGGAFFHSPRLTDPHCPPPATRHNLGCLVRRVPSAYEAFVHKNGWYVKPNPHLSFRSEVCPAGTKFDSRNCLYGTAPDGHKAEIHLGHFVFERKAFHKCEKIRPGADAFGPLLCKVGKVPAGHAGFVYENRWYTGPTPGGPGEWFVRKGLKDPAVDLRPLCRKDGPSRKWKLAWADEFDDKADGQRCFTTDDQLQCVYEPYWGFRRCEASPADWSSKGKASWTADQRAKYGGLASLDKCRWTVLDSHNMWDASNAPGERTNSFRPENVRIEGGLLKMKTASHPPAGGAYDCGRQTNPNPDTQGPNTTRNCPHSGAMIWSLSGLPWTQGNDPGQADPARRYVGKAPAYGRYEFRASIPRMGHGAWPALWMFADQKSNPAEGPAELDALELLADLQGDEKQIVQGTGSYGQAWQTAHNWGVDSAGYPHTSEGVGIPISIGEFHVYAVEWEPAEIRFYVDGCLRNKIHDHDLVKLDGGGTREFRVPKDQTINILIGNPASAASWLPKWYRAWGGGNMNGRADFVPTELHVDYVRFYEAEGAPRALQRAPAAYPKKSARTVHKTRAEPGRPAK